LSLDIQRAAKSFKLNTTKGRTIHVEQYTPLDSDPSDAEDSPVIFFIHGVGGSVHIWEAQIRSFLREGYEIIAFDLLGHGSSSCPRSERAYMFAELARDVLYVFDTFCRRRNVLVGHSYGTSFCILLSNERENLVSKMVLIAGGGPTTLRPDNCSVFSLPKLLFYLVQPGLVRIFCWRAFDRKANRSVRDKFPSFFGSSFVWKAVMQGQYWSDCDEDFHENISVPALLIHGTGDHLVTLSEEVHMSEVIYGSKLEIVENAGHMVMIEAPNEVNRAIQDFLDQDSSTWSRSKRTLVKGTQKIVVAEQKEQASSTSLQQQRDDVITDNGMGSTADICDEVIDSHQRTTSRMSRPATASDKRRSKKMY